MPMNYKKKFKGSSKCTSFFFIYWEDNITDRDPIIAMHNKNRKNNDNVKVQNTLQKKYYKVKNTH